MRLLCRRCYGLAGGATSALDAFLLPEQVLVLQQVTHLVPLGAQVADIVVLGVHLDVLAAGDAQAVALQRHDLLRVVGHDADRRESQVGEDLGADAVVAQVGGEAQFHVGLNGVQTLLLERVGLELVDEPDAAALLAHVEHDAEALRFVASQGLGELLAAVAAQRAEGVAGEALGVHPHEHVLAAGDVALDEGDVVAAVDHGFVAHGLEVAILGGHRHGGGPADELLVAAPVLDEVGDGDDLEAVLLGVRDEIGHAGHRAVVVHDLADDGRGVQAGEAREVDAGLRLPRALEHAAGARHEGEHVSRLHERLGPGLWIDGHLDGVCAVGGGDACGDALARLDRDGERRLQARLVVGRHRRQIQLRAALRRERQADEATAFLGHEVDACGGGELRGHREVALVLAVLVVADDDHPALAQVVERIRDGREMPFAVPAGAFLVAAHENPASANFSQVSPPSGLRPATNAYTYLAMRSASRLTRTPGASRASVVTAAVCGIRDTRRRRPSTAAIVRLTPSTATEPCATLTSLTACGASTATTRALSSGVTRTTVPTPSMCPLTRCPPRRDCRVRARSRLRRSPGRLSASVVRRTVSGITSAVKPPGRSPVTVRQTPSLRMLSPTAAPSVTTGAAATSSTALFSPTRRLRSVPTSSTIPVNT